MPVRYGNVHAAIVFALILSSCTGESPPEGERRLRVATTTSLYDTGLWAYLEPIFEKENGVELDVLCAGTGRALDWGRRGDVDVITVHSRIHEEAFIEEGYGIERIPFACNHFVIIGPPGDPARIKTLSPEAAFTRLLESGTSSFVSRGDDSGTPWREKEIWSAAGYEYGSEVHGSGEWYVEAGCGMGPALVMADEMRAYTLSDIGTWLSYGSELELVPLVIEGEMLLNVYSVIVVTDTQDRESAQRLADFLVSEPVQDLMGAYGVTESGLQLFTPCAGCEPGTI